MHGQKHAITATRCRDLLMTCGFEVVAHVQVVTSWSGGTLLQPPLFFRINLSLNCVELVTGKDGIMEVLASDLTEVRTGSPSK